MKPSHLAACLAVVALAFAAPASEALAADSPTDAKDAGGVQWAESYAGAVKKAKEDGSPMLLKFYATWCPHCAEMAKTTWKDEGVAKLTRDFVAVQVNSEVEKVPVKRYGVQGVPVLIVAEPGGEEVFRLTGEKSARQVSGYLQTYLKHGESLTAAFGRLRADRADPEAHVALGDFYSSVGLSEQAGGHYVDALDEAQGDLWLRACAGAGAALVEDEDYKKARKLIQQGLERSGDAPSAKLLLARAQLESDTTNEASARPWFERVVAEHADSKEAATARKALK